MDDAASTTLLTFRLDSPQHVRSIELLGSWDNFTHPYRLDRDPRRGTEHWAGCFRFKDIICDGFQQATPSKRQGGLMMGGTYWYYYKLDDSLEYHDPTKPWTTACPLLPGQNLNVIEVPHETPSTKDDLDTTPCPILTPAFTLDPHSRFTTPRPNKFEAICRKPLPTLPGPLELQVTRDSWKSAHSPVSPPVADTERPFSSNSRHSLSESLRSWKAFSFLRKARSAGNPVKTLWPSEFPFAKRPYSAGCHVKRPDDPRSDSGIGSRGLTARKGNTRSRAPMSPVSVQRPLTLHGGNRSRDGRSEGFMHEQSPLQRGPNDNATGTCSESLALMTPDNQTAPVDATRSGMRSESLVDQVPVRSDCAEREHGPILGLSLSAMETLVADSPTNSITGLPDQDANATTDVVINRTPAEVAEGPPEGDMRALKFSQRHASSGTEPSRAPFTESSGPLLFRSALASIRKSMASLELTADGSNATSATDHQAAIGDLDKGLAKSPTFSSLASEFSWGDCLRDFSGQTSPSFSAYSYNPADVSDDEQPYSPLDTPNDLLSRHISNAEQGMLTTAENHGRRTSDFHDFHYSLPDDYNSSQVTLTKITTASPTAIVRPSTPPASHHINNMTSELSEMQKLMDEFGYLGEVIA